VVFIKAFVTVFHSVMGQQPRAYSLLRPRVLGWRFSTA
jgi:hypothetical protein